MKIEYIFYFWSGFYKLVFFPYIRILGSDILLLNLSYLWQCEQYVNGRKNALVWRFYLRFSLFIYSVQLSRHIADTFLIWVRLAEYSRIKCELHILKGPEKEIKVYEDKRKMFRWVDYISTNTHLSQTSAEDFETTALFSNPL